MAHSSRNKTIAGGVPKLSRSAVYRKRALYKRKKTVTKSTKAAVKVCTVLGERGAAVVHGFGGVLCALCVRWGAGGGFEGV